MKWKVRLFTPFIEEEFEAKSAKEAEAAFYSELDPRVDTADTMLDVQEIEE